MGGLIVKGTTMIATLALIATFSLPDAKAQPRINRVLPDFRTAANAIVLALECEKLYGDAEIVNAAREVMIYALRNQGLEDPYKGADTVIKQLGKTGTRTDSSAPTVESCRRTKYGLLAMMR